MGSQLLKNLVTDTLEDSLCVSPKIIEFLLHHTLKLVDKPKYYLSITLTTTIKRILEQEDIGIDALALNHNLLILSVQTGIGTLDDVLFNGRSSVNIIIKEVRV